MSRVHAGGNAAGICRFARLDRSHIEMRDGHRLGERRRRDQWNCKSNHKHYITDVDLAQSVQATES